MNGSNAARPLEEGNESQPVRAPLFNQALEPFEEDQRRVVLDLGRIRSGTVELFSNYRCRLDVVDLPSALGQLPDLEEPGAAGRWLDRLLPAGDDEKVDLFLCWNLLNYLPAALIEALGRRLSERAADGARLHALIEYRATRMTVVPKSFAPQGTEIVADPVDETNTVAAPRYTPKEMEKRLPGFASERTMLLGNGMQEFLFRRRPASR